MRLVVRALLAGAVGLSVATGAAAAPSKDPSRDPGTSALWLPGPEAVARVQGLLGSAA